MVSQLSWRALPRSIRDAAGTKLCCRYTHSASIRAHRLSEPSSLIQPFPTDATRGETAKGDDFVLYENFFTLDETKQLALMALWKLDRVDSVRRRKRRSSTSQGESAPATPQLSDSAILQELFEGEYGFEEGHYDSVIHQYRETLLSNLPPPSPAFADAPALMKRVYDLLPASTTTKSPPAEQLGVQLEPPPGSSTHLLHLAPDGAILPHVDNVEASGSIIIGVSLGAERILRLRRSSKASPPSLAEGWDVRLPSGSVYFQRDAIRYSYEHSILPYEHNDSGSASSGSRLVPGHRISIMVRDAATKTASL